MEVTFKQKPESCKVSGEVVQAGESVQRPWGGRKEVCLGTARRWEWPDQAQEEGGWRGGAGRTPGRPSDGSLSVMENKEGHHLTRPRKITQAAVRNADDGQTQCLHQSLISP